MKKNTNDDIIILIMFLIGIPLIIISVLFSTNVENEMITGIAGLIGYFIIFGGLIILTR